MVRTFKTFRNSPGGLVIYTKRPHVVLRSVRTLVHGFLGYVHGFLG